MMDFNVTGKIERKLFEDKVDRMNARRESKRNCLIKMKEGKILYAMR